MSTRSKQTTLLNGTLPKGIVRDKNKGNAFIALAGVVGGRKIRKRFGFSTFGGEAQALDTATAWCSEKRREIMKNRYAVIDVPDRERLEILEARDLLEPYGVSIIHAVRLAVQSLQKIKIRTAITLEAGIAEFLKSKALEDCKPRYLNALTIELNAFAEAYDAGTKVSDISADDIEEFLGAREISAITWNNWRRDLRTFFNFASSARYRWIAENPIESVSFKKVDYDEVTILELEEVTKLLEAAANHETSDYRGDLIKGRQVPWMVLGLFGGLRRDEADAVQWEDIDWDTNSIKVSAAKKRGHAYRYVHMRPVMINWLERFKKEKGPIGTGAEARRSDLKKLSEITGLDLSKNLYRHSFGSYHYQGFKNMAETMAEMGHYNAKTFVTYYNRPIPKMRALAYWELQPEEVLK